MVALVGFLGAVMVFIIVLSLVVVYRQIENRLYHEKDLSQPYGEITDLVTRQRDKLASYGWVDQEKGIVSVPIGRAIDLVVAEVRATGHAKVVRPEGDVEEAAEETSADETGEPADESPSSSTRASEEADDAEPQ